MHQRVIKVSKYSYHKRANSTNENNQQRSNINLRKSISEISIAWNCGGKKCTNLNSFVKVVLIVRKNW